ncbi:proline-rich receptor-like protein kinase PERK9 [Phoenix dactylifera]|uniref:Proline-rich receptor-like protein kinase PERK9 n=1 Tax=Phoenix dactylifera TaxID=42345 RepID=A0A8B7BIM0_PHODC|nr:proline-rich receptor-like protein kinase PERK9 [Phoenix dactylifera]
MANQPPTGRRPWFRLASQVLRESTAPLQPVQTPLVRQPGAVLPPQSQPPPVQPQPQAPRPPSPAQPQPPREPTPPPPPPPPAAAAQPSVTPPQAESTEPASPSGVPPKQPSSPPPPLRPIKTSRSPPPQSPKVKSPSPIPSPSPRYDSGDRTLKPSPEPELKTIPEAQPKSTTNNDKGEPYKNARNGEPKRGTSQADTRAPPPSPKREAKKKDEGDMRMITIAGDNMGASMDLGPLYSRKQQQQKSNASLPKRGQASDSATDDGKSSDKNGARAAAKAKPITSLVNGNVQGVNNSIVFNSTYSYRSPGVHIALSSHRNPKSKAHPPPQ